MRPSCYNRGHNILEICNILEKLGFTASKEVVDIKHKKHCIELPYKLPNDHGWIAEWSYLIKRQSTII